jgi:competence protein ComEC
MSLVAAPCSLSLSLVFNNANWSLAKIILGLVHVFAVLPEGHIYVERPHWPTGARAEITVLDAGAGAAVHLRAGGTDWLFDAGSARDYERFLRDYLHSRGVDRLDGLVLSHGDSLHIGGAMAVLDELKPKRVIDNGAPDRSRVHEVVRQHRTEIVASDARLALSRNVAAHILYPDAGFAARAADDEALVVQLIIDGKFRVLLVSDSGEATERQLLAHPDKLQSDILIKGHHHTGDSGSIEFLEAVRPQLIVATSCDFPARERIPDDWAKRVKDRGFTLFRQDQTGAVDLEFFRNEWRATPFLGQPVFRSPRR